LREPRESGVTDASSALGPGCRGSARRFRTIGRLQEPLPEDLQRFKAITVDHTLDIGDWIEGFHNRQRLHSSAGCRSRCNIPAWLRRLDLDVSGIRAGTVTQCYWNVSGHDCQKERQGR
jgi:hypothetical protein